MTKIAWDESLSIGVNIIDQQHRQIAHAINDLAQACQQGDRQKVTEFIETLQYHTQSHFAYEEELMEKSGYPMAETHKLNHEFFGARIDQYANAHETGLDIGQDLLRELQAWWVRHTQKEDILITGYAREYLLSEESGTELLNSNFIHLH